MTHRYVLLEWDPSMDTWYVAISTDDLPAAQEGLGKVLDAQLLIDTQDQPRAPEHHQVIVFDGPILCSCGEVWPCKEHRG